MSADYVAANQIFPAMAAIIIAREIRDHTDHKKTKKEAIPPSVFQRIVEDSAKLTKKVCLCMRCTREECLCFLEVKLMLQ